MAPKLKGREDYINTILGICNEEERESTQADLENLNLDQLRVFYEYVIEHTTENKDIDYYDVHKKDDDNQPLLAIKALKLGFDAEFTEYELKSFTPHLLGGSGALTVLGILGLALGGWVGLGILIGGCILTGMFAGITYQKHINKGKKLNTVREVFRELEEPSRSCDQVELTQMTPKRDGRSLGGRDRSPDPAVQQQIEEQLRQCLGTGPEPKLNPTGQ
jgi:hypothetical protein